MQRESYIDFCQADIDINAVCSCVGERMESMFEEGGEVPPVDPVKIKHSQVERPIIPSSPERDNDSKPSTSETSGEETMSTSAGKSPRLPPKPGEFHEKIQLMQKE